MPAAGIDVPLYVVECNLAPETAAGRVRVRTSFPHRYFSDASQTAWLSQKPPIFQTRDGAGRGPLSLTPFANQPTRQAEGATPQLVGDRAARKSANRRANHRNRPACLGEPPSRVAAVAMSHSGSFATPERPSLSLPAAKYDVASACVGFCRLSSDGRGKLAGPRTRFNSEVPVGDCLNRVTVVRVAHCALPSRDQQRRTVLQYRTRQATREGPDVHARGQHLHRRGSSSPAATISMGSSRPSGWARATSPAPARALKPRGVRLLPGSTSGTAS